jgi:hypothetical protein
MNVELLQQLSQAPLVVPDIVDKQTSIDLNWLLSFEYAQLRWTSPCGDDLGFAVICPMPGAWPTAHITAKGTAKLAEVGP